MEPLKESRAEIVYASTFIDWFSEEGKEFMEEVYQLHKMIKE